MQSFSEFCAELREEKARKKLQKKYSHLHSGIHASKNLSDRPQFSKTEFSSPQASVNPQAQSAPSADFMFPVPKL